MLLKLNLQRFAPAIVFITINFDSHISKVTYSGVEWTASGQNQQTAIVDGSTGVFTVTLDSGYVLDTVTLGSDFENTTLSAKTDTSFSLLFGNTSGGTITITSKQTSSSGETWVLNKLGSSTLGNNTFNVNFTSNSVSYNKIVCDRLEQEALYYGSVKVWQQTIWTNEAYRTIKFETPPTGDLLTWLQANGTKQETSAHKLTFGSNITITVNGSSVTTSPYNLTNGDVITATTGGGYKISINGTLYGGTSTININNQDINIVRSTAETFDTLLVTINYTETTTPTYSFKHWKKSNVKINEQSTETWLFNSPMTDTSTNKEINITFTSNGETFTKLAIRLNKGIMNYVKSDGTSVGAYEDGWAGNPQYQTITVDTRQANYQELRTFLNSNASIQSSNKYYFKPYTILGLYRIDTTLTNCTGASANATKIQENGGLTLTFTANSGYELPTGVSVTNVTSYNWNKSTGVLAISKPTGDVTITIVAESALPQLATPTNVSVTDTTLTFDEVENATSYEVFVDDVSIGTHTIASGETWLLNSPLVFGTKSWSYNINFTSNGNSYSKFSYNFIDPIEGSYLVYGTTNVYSTNTLWTNEAYRTVTFATPPTGDLLTWLQANGTKQ